MNLKSALPVILAGCLSTHGAHVLAQTIQKCVQPDGSILYQQDVCPVGSDAKVFAVASGTPSTLTLPPNSNHQYSTTLTVNGVTVTGFVDTGATLVSISTETAARMHINKENMRAVPIQTANGTVVSAIKRIDRMRIGNFDLYNVDVAIMPNSPTLIGMSALSQLKVATENGNMVLTKR